MNGIGLISLSHEYADLLLRQKISLTPTEQKNFMKRLKQQYPIKGVLILATCNRLEIYFEGAITCNKLIASLCQFKNLEIESYLQSFKKSNNLTEIVTHLARVAAGFRSSIKGDKEVIGQLKKAYQLTLSEKMQGTLLERTMQCIFRIYKKFRNHPDYRESSTSWGYSCLKTIKREINLSDKSLLLVGSGSMIRDLVKYLPRFECREVSIVNRTEHKAKGIAERYRINWLPWEHFPAQIFNFDAVVFTLAVNEPVVGRPLPNEITKKTRIWIDLGMPANVEENFSIPALKKYSLDYFTGLVNQGINYAANQQNFINEIIAEELPNLIQWKTRYEIYHIPLVCH